MTIRQNDQVPGKIKLCISLWFRGVFIVYFWVNRGKHWQEKKKHEDEGAENLKMVFSLSS